MFESLTKSIYINGEWKEVNAKKTQVIYNPATLEALTEVAYGGQEETKEAIDAASHAFQSWSEMTGRQRSRVLYKASEMMRKDAKRLGQILTMEQGKPLKEALGEVKGAAGFLLWYAEEASRGYGEWIPSSIPSKRMLVIPKPVGVVGAITPWNFPASMITRKLGPALAAGCTAVLKPSPETPLSAIEIVKIFEQAGMPKGVINLVTGDAQAIGQEMLTNKNVKMITFTGSTEVGKYLMRESANHVKKVALELGGHAPIIAFEDADIDKATTLALGSKFRNNGQTCICANRLYVHEDIIEEFTNVLKEKVEKLKVGSGLEEDTDLGPLISEKATEKVQAHLDDAVQKGASIVCGGSKWNGELKGYFYPPTVISNVTDDMVVMREETFGPLFPIQPFSDEDRVIQKANNTDYGLAAYIFTENTSRTLRVAEKLDYGIVGVNDVFPAVPEAPFGGIKQSGNGKEGGHHGMDEFLEKKFVSIGIE
ncbi:succinate-semialdehyde dehydrogenase / glutarate-semialdehyde dehydrogenase [Oceanobacillus limi]|uniref:Succinate-semialdehyde dehydrogenase / glutarate-semialdehyde dehydrogenase n=1 Tax=Oceanobacillus limi TaxID=930131 RepID=A0A1I0E0A3_9BACI|nr:NAD-dependent succinate-semialdehyde dehydrogenase [Oceanobacillus limi]SET38147.1 succinate-semialdehyde dehydrogenase / glutarate-semialdehyde dehydrogenase [Oceanobacillus limi]